MASSFFSDEFNDDVTFSSEIKNLKNSDISESGNVTNVEDDFLKEDNAVKRSETLVSIEATTETDSRMGLLNTEQESLEMLNAFDNLKISKAVSDLLDNDNSPEIIFNKQMEKSPQTETITKPFYETSTEGQYKKKFEMGNLNINIQNMYGNVYMNCPLKKSDVSNPDGISYSATKTRGGCLLNSVSLDKDIQMNWIKICNEFNIQIPPVEPMDKYDFLYDNLRRCLMESNQTTRYQFLVRLARVADITHLCQT